MTTVYWRKVLHKNYANHDNGELVADWEMPNPPRIGERVMLGFLRHGLHEIVNITWTGSRNMVAWIAEVDK